MTSKSRDEHTISFRFGGGVHTRASEDQIDPRECANGSENFILDPGNGEFRPRPPFDLIGTAPNGSEVRGFATLLKTDGTTSLLVQAGDTVYEISSTFTFTSRGTVSASAKLRGGLDAQWTLTDKVIITDINLAEEIQEWDGTTLAQTTFTTDGSTAFGTFRAKYCYVENERAFFGNLHDNGTDSPHLLVGAKRGDFTVISTAVRPADGNGATDAWFLPMPQLRPINGIASGFGIIAVSQEQGAFEKITGTTAKDYALVKFFRGSGAAGAESVISTGNDIIYGRTGRLESLKSTEKFGDVQIDDPSFKISDQVKDTTSWTVHYNQRLHRVYAFASGGSEVWVADTDMMGSAEPLGAKTQGPGISPWMKWTTQHSLAFQPTASMVGYDPLDKLEYLFMGDSTGKVYRMEGSGTSGDGGTTDIKAVRRSGQFSPPVDAKMFRLSGCVKSRKKLANTLTLRLLWSGEHVHNVVKTVTLPAVTFSPVWNGTGTTAMYWGSTGGTDYWNAEFEDRLIRNLWTGTGMGNDLQIEAEIEGVNDFAIAEIGIRFDAAS